MPEIDVGEIDPDAPLDVDLETGEVIDLVPAEMDTDAFWIVFQTVFNMPGLLMPQLRALSIQQIEEQAARAASDAIHALLLIYYPAALRPQSEVLAHLMIAGPFLIGKAIVVRELIAAHKAKPVNQKSAPEQKPAPEQQPDAGRPQHRQAADSEPHRPVLVGNVLQAVADQEETE